MYMLTPYRQEPGHRTTLPVWIKSPIIVGVVAFVVVVRRVLEGFMTVFPMVGVIAAYEARHSLYTMCRQMSIVLLTLTPLMATCRLTQAWLGLSRALAVAWLVFVICLTAMTRLTDRRDAAIRRSMPETERVP